MIQLESDCKVFGENLFEVRHCRAPGGFDPCTDVIINVGDHRQGAERLNERLNRDPVNNRLSISDQMSAVFIVY